MINEILPHSFNVQYNSEASLQPDDYILHYTDHSILLNCAGTTFLPPQWKDVQNSIHKEDCTYLFSLNDKQCFLCPTPSGNNQSPLQYQDINIFRTLPKEIGWICILGFQLHNWYTNHQYCGKCGAPTQLKTSERAIVCSACSTTNYPTISPAIIVAVICNDKLLLARGSHFPEGRYSLVAGYADVGETLEETVAREVKEEVGLDVKNIRYYRNHPWPLSGSLMIGFIAEADDQQPITPDNKEIVEAAWFRRDNLPPHSPHISISGEMIDKFKKGEL
ncbi:NAD(+) diphosphatase [Carboxylicivirga taeanensis]|uniref:NAD(+) diphosphatase n=1 Tax=Carboxylicivirga taeanensis TaxID=1416875 RepID=UPI003F6E38BF